MEKESILMKRILGMPVLLALLLVLTACGGGKGASGTVEAAPEPEFQMGEMSGGVYTNEFLGIGCSLDSNWAYLTNEEILELNADAVEQMPDEELREMLETADVIQDMYAQADDGMLSMTICFENLGVIDGVTVDEAAYLEAAIPVLEQSLTGIGVTDVTIEKMTETLAGEERQAVKLSGMLDAGMAIYQEQIYLKKGNYIAIITLCSGREDLTAQLAAMFYALDK